MSNTKTLARFMSRELLVLAAALLLAATFVVTRGASAQTANAAPDIIAFERHASIFTMNADGSNPQQVTPGYLIARRPAWSPDGQRLAFICGSERPDICVINADGSNLQVLTSSEYNTNPAWSPDGQRIAFARQTNQGPRIYTMNPDGSNPQPLAFANPYGPDADYPAFSPDGSRIAFVGAAAEGNEIYTVNADGTGQLAQVTNSQHVKQNLTYSPDGAQIAFDTVNDLRLVSAFGGQETVLASEWDTNSQPSWSPDGTRIAFYRRRALYDENDSHIGNEQGLFLINPATGHIASLNAPEGADPAFRPALTEPTPEPSPSPSPSPSPETSPAQRINELSALVRSFGVNHGITNSLTVKLQHARDDLNRGRTANACSHLATFISQARAQSGKHLTTAQATQIINEATSIRTALGCS